MYPQKFDEFPPPPGVISSLRAGFEAVSSHVGLIFLPATLDIFLWLGPRLSVEALVSPFFSASLSQAWSPLSSTASLKEVTEAVSRFNLLSLLGRLQIFPIGISSLLAKTRPIETPLGSQQVVEVTSGTMVIGLAFLLILAGWILGGLYFRWVAGTTLGAAQLETGIGHMRAIVQTLILSVVWFIGSMAILIPFLFIFSILAIINPVLATAAIFIVLILSFWLIVPLFFTPHGIFVRRQNAFYSIFTSFRMARFTLPTSGLFVVCVFLLSTGLDFLWSVPPDDSWMKLVGIGGHAFITTALLAASFVYYRDMNVWLQSVFERLQQKQGMPTQQV